MTAPKHSGLQSRNGKPSLSEKFVLPSSRKQLGEVTLRHGVAQNLAPDLAQLAADVELDLLLQLTPAVREHQRLLPLLQPRLRLSEQSPAGAEAISRAADESDLLVEAALLGSMAASASGTLGQLQGGFQVDLVVA